jgi:hypothetical protein
MNAAMDGVERVARLKRASAIYRPRGLGCLMKASINPISAEDDQYDASRMVPDRPSIWSVSGSLLRAKAYVKIVSNPTFTLSSNFTGAI